jgi:hypothetical protein
MTKTPAPRKVYLYGCSVVAPGASDVSEFRQILELGQSQLTPMSAFNQAFLIGKPKFSFSRYQQWFTDHHDHNRYHMLDDKGGENVKMAIGCTIDALESNPGLSETLKKLDPGVLIQISSGLGDLNVSFQSSKKIELARRQWNAFWASAEQNEILRAWQSGDRSVADAPVHPTEFPVDSFERADAWEVWNQFWAEKNPHLAAFVERMGQIDSKAIGSDIEHDKLHLIRAKAKSLRELIKEFGCPQPPWEAVSPNLIWNIANVPASQISMLLNLHGASSGLAAACSSFGFALHEATRSIMRGDADAAIIGSVDSTPSPELVSAFYNGRLAIVGQKPGVPLCEMRGTHISGGACVWIIGAEDAFAPLAIKPLPIEILGVGLSSDAHHIITPSAEGPKLAINRALQAAGIKSSEIDTWDMHATGTPGDWSELHLIDDYVRKDAPVTARKGIFGHGMSVAAGWELTAQAACTSYQPGTRTFRIAPTGVDRARVHECIASLGRQIVCNEPVEISSRTADGSIIQGKLSMGIGGISSCVILRRHPGNI